MNYSEPPGITWTNARPRGLLSRRSSITVCLKPNATAFSGITARLFIASQVSTPWPFPDYSAGGGELSRAVGQQSGVYRGPALGFSRGGSGSHRTLPAAHTCWRPMRIEGIGARAPQVVRLVLGSTAWATLGGLAGGFIASFVVSRFLTGQLYGVSRLDPAAYATVATVLIVAATLATWLPARRATRVDPATALRVE